MEALQCSTCPIEDHEGINNYFCRCEYRNIKIAKQLRQRGINVWEKSDKKKELEKKSRRYKASGHE